MRAILGELRQALRLLRKTPTVTMVAIVTLALGIGANVAIFSVVSGVLLRPLPYHDPDRLMVIWESTPKFPEMSCSWLDYVDWTKQQRTFDSIAIARGTGYTLTGLGAATPVKARMSSANWFRVLGVEPRLGRAFADGEDDTGAAPVALVSDKFWREWLGSDPNAVGRLITLDGKAFQVIGVLPASYIDYDDYAVFVTMAELDPMTRNDRGDHPGLYAVGRLSAGVTVAQGRADLVRVARAIDRSGDPHAGSIEVLPAMAPFQAERVKDVRATLLVLLGAVAFVLLIACANVANLMLARGTARSRELAVRAALGASRWALMRPLLLESALIAAIGGVFGVVLALWGVDLLAAMRPGQIPRMTVIAIDRTVLVYSLGLTTVTALLCGLVPSLKASRTDINESLKAAGARGVSGVAHGRLRAALVVAEVAMALVLLVGAGLSLRTFARLSKVDPGFKSENLMHLRITLSAQRFADATAVRHGVAEVRRRLEAIPGSEAAAVAVGMPFFGAPENSFHLHDQPDEERFTVAYYTTPGLVRSLGLTLLAGRDFTDGDDNRHELVALVDAELARTFFPNGALGRTLDFGNPKQPRVLRIVGVVKPILHYGLEGEVPARLQVYIPLYQVPDDVIPLLRTLHVALRGAHAAQLVAPARATLGELDPDMPLYEVTSMAQRIADSVGGRRFATVLLGLFAGVALLLALVGLYAVMSYMVTQRHHEIGVRMALGARGRDVERMIVRQGLVLVVVGLGIGLGTSLALAKVMAALVNDLSPTDPLTYGVVATLLLGAALLASFVPARAATRVDPMVVLRYE
jgi:predicted permease